MITLYDADRCPYCARVRIALAEKGVEHDLVEIDLTDRPAWIYEKNDTGRVPVVEEDAWLLPESSVILEYLEERYPEPPLLPADPGERALARFFVFRFDDLGSPYYALRRGEPGAAERPAHALADLDHTLSAMPFLTGRAFGLADVAYVPWLLRMRDTMGVALDAYPALTGWLERCCERASVAAEVETVASLAA